MKCTSCAGIGLGLSLVFVTSVRAQNLSPPLDGPTWWQNDPAAPRDDATRCQYHSFISNPNPPDDLPDYTYNGYEVTPGEVDAWSYFALGLGGDVANPNAGYGDGKAAILAADVLLKKHMANLARPQVKEYFVEIVWKRVIDGPGITPTLTLGYPGHPAAPVNPMVNTQLPGNWNCTRWSDTISPQPSWEEFGFRFTESVYIDSAWLGTNCIPEPSSFVVLVGVAGMAVSRTRRL